MKDRARIHFLLADDAVIVPIDDETYHQNMQHFNDCIPVILATLKRAGIPDTEENVRYWISDMAERSNMDICGDGWRQILGYDIANYYASAIRKTVKDSRLAGSVAWDEKRIKDAVRICGLDEQSAYHVFHPLGIDIPVSAELKKILDQIEELKTSVKAS